MKESGKIVHISFDVDNLIIDAPCPACIFNELTFDQYKRLMFMLYDAFINLDDYYQENKDVKQRKSKKKSRQKDIQKSSR